MEESCGFKVFMASCAGGSALAWPSGNGLLYTQLLAELPAGLQWLVPVVCGNDLYHRGRILEADASVLAAVDGFCVAAKAKAPQVFAVVGGSSAVWRYNRTLSHADAQRFDAEVVRLRARFHVWGVSCPVCGDSSLPPALFFLHFL